MADADPLSPTLADSGQRKIDDNPISIELVDSVSPALANPVSPTQNDPSQTKIDDNLVSIALVDLVSFALTNPVSPAQDDLGQTKIDDNPISIVLVDPVSPALANPVSPAQDNPGQTKIDDNPISIVLVDPVSPAQDDPGQTRVDAEPICPVLADPVTSVLADPVASVLADPGQTMADTGVATRTALSPELIAAIAESYKVTYSPSFSRKVLIESIADLLCIQDMNHSDYQKIVLKTILKRVCDDYDDPSFQSMTAAHISDIVSNLFVPFTGLPLVFSSNRITVSRERIPIVMAELLVFISSWNLKRVLLESQLFGHIILTCSFDINERDVFRYIMQSTYENSSLNLDDIYYVQVLKVKDHCSRIANDLRDMMEKLTNCHILPVVPLSPSLDEIERFWKAVSDLFSDDKKYLSLKWLRSSGKSVFLDHYIDLRSSESKRYGVEALRIVGENEWDALRIRQKHSAVSMKKHSKKEAASATLGSEKRIPTEYWARLIPIRNKFFSYNAYQDMTVKRREFVGKLLKLGLF